ncbi:hypothetical protein TrST_g10429 [Triparma strigata]|uniref:Fibronectin type-III domain-containing protein n=1 Tax=Triparma strigata TaxID=1606541 RepID=A0A9W7C4L6_9STRA|nr:hypothetical protein TrST_g10429 [Triparma strigata]
MVSFPSFRKKKPKIDPVGEPKDGEEANDDDGLTQEQRTVNKIAEKAAAEPKKKKGKTDEEQAAEAMKLSQGDNPTSYCSGCRAWLCRCGRATKEDRERLKVLKEKKEIEESERKDRQKELDDMGSEEKLTWDALELPERNCNRLIENNKRAKRAAVEKARADAEKDAENKEEGATYHHCQLKEFKRYKASPALHTTYEGHKNHIHAFKVSADYRYVVSGSADFTIKLWDTKTTKCIRTFEGHAKAVRDIDIIPGFNFADENRLILSASSDKTLRMWDARSDGAKRVFKGHSDVIYSCNFAPDGNTFISSSEDCTIRLWSTHEGHLIYIYNGHESAILSTRFSPGGRFLLSASDFGERQIKLWHARMPVVRVPVSLGQRIFFTKGGLIKKMLFVENPGEDFFRDPDSDDEAETLAMLSRDGAAHDEDDPSLANKEHGEGGDPSSSRPTTPGTPKTDGESDEEGSKNPNKKFDVKEEDGFSLTVLSEGRFGKLVDATGYYPGQELIVNIRGVKTFQSFFVAAYLKNSQFDMFGAESGGRCGSFDRASVMENDDAWVTCRHGGQMRAATSDTRKKNRSFNELRLKWNAPLEGVGDITFKVTIQPKDMDDPDLKRVYGLSYSLQETMPPRKRGGSSGFASSSRGIAFKPKVKLSFDVSFNHNHMLSLFRENELELVEHYFTKDVKCALPMGKLGNETARGPKEVITLLADRILGPNQIMKSVKPMPPTENIIESRTIVVRDELPPSHASLDQIRDALKHEGHESSSDDESDTLASDEGSVPSYSKNRQSNPNEAAGDDGTIDSELTGATGPSMEETDESPERAALRQEYMKVAKLEVLMIKQMKQQRLACADEVRTIHLPAHKAHEITNFAVENDELVHNGFYGNKKHLMMALPPNYPINARPYDLAAQAARKGKKLMEAARKEKKKDETIDVKLNTPKGRQELAEEIVEYMLHLHDKEVEIRAKERRYGAASLPGFENLAEQRQEDVKPHYVERIGNWIKGDHALDENTRSANVRATVNTRKAGDEGAKLIKQMKGEREAANQRLKEDVETYEKDVKKSKKRNERKSKLTWGPDKIAEEIKDIHLDELLEDDVTGDGDDEGEGKAEGANQKNRKSRGRGFGSTFSKLMFGSSNVSSPTDSEADGDESKKSLSKPSPLKSPKSPKTKKKLMKKQSTGDWLSKLSFKTTKKDLPVNDDDEDDDDEIDDVREVTKPTKSPVDDLDALVNQAVGIIAPEVAKNRISKNTDGDANKSSENKPTTNTSIKSNNNNENNINNGDNENSKEGEELENLETYGKLPDNDIICLTTKTSLKKRDILNLRSKGASHIRRNDFATLPGFEHGHHRHTDNSLVNYDNDLLLAEQGGGLIRTFLEDSGRQYDGHAASINEVAFSHDERRVASCSSDKTIKLWDPLDGNMVYTIYGHADEVMGVNFSHDGMFLVSCGLDNLVIVWNLTNGAILKKLFGHYDAVYRCCFTHNANSLMSSSCDMTLKSWNLTPHVPDPPQRPLMSEVTTNKALMSWLPPPGYNEEITAFFIEYRIGHRGDFGNTLSVSGRDSRRRITGLLPGTAYQFRIRAMNRMGKGPWSDPSAQVITEFGVPQKLERPEVADVSTNDILIQWWAPVPSVKGSAIHEFRLELSGYGVEFGQGQTWNVSWNDAKQANKDWEVEKKKRDAREESGKDETDEKKTGKKLLKGNINKLMMGLRAKRDTRDAKKSAAKEQDQKFMDEIKAELATEEEAKKKLVLDEKGNIVGKEEGKKVVKKLNWMEMKAERKKQFMIREIERTKQHLEDQKARRKKREQARRLKKEGKRKQKKLEKKYDKSEELRLQQEEAEKRHRKLYTQMAFRATNLEPGIMYRIRVGAVNTTGLGPFSDGCFSTFTLSTPPQKGEPPHLLEATLFSLEVEWSTPHDNGAAITGFMLRQCWNMVEHEYKRTVQRILIPDLEPGKSYQFQVKSCNSEGWSEWSPKSKPLQTLTKEPDRPEKPEITGKTPVSIKLKVKRPEGNGDPVYSYVVRKREMSVKRKTPWGPAGAFVAESVEVEEECEGLWKLNPHTGKAKWPFAIIEIGFLHPNSHYDFQVQALNRSGRSEFSPSSFRTKTLPAGLPLQVENVTCSNIGPSTITVLWEEPHDMGGPIIGYNIQESVREEDWHNEKLEKLELYKAGSGMLKKRFDALDSTYAYRYRVAARSKVGVGPWSEWSDRVESVKNDPTRATGVSSSAGKSVSEMLNLKKSENGADSDRDDDNNSDKEEKKNNQLSPGNAVEVEELF